MSGKTILSIAILVATGCAWADAGNWKVPRWWAFLSAPDAVKKVVDGKCSGHVQGMCVTSNAFYFSFHNQIVKTDWKGRLLKRVEVARHGEDVRRRDAGAAEGEAVAGMDQGLRRHHMP